jgi:hypothetical protein
MFLSSVLVIFTSGMIALANDPPTTGEAGKMEAGKMDPAKMAEMAKLGAPGENHKALNDVVGKWKFTSRWWMSPEAKPEESKGTATSKWVLGGRFVQQEVKGKMGHQSFEGTGYTGYDNIKGEYQAVWMDNMTTGMMFSNGKRDADTKVIAQTGTFACPMTGEKERWFRNELKVANKNEHTFAMYTKTADGKEFKTMEIEYKRVGKAE